jgi:hypothetical protein
MTTVVVSAAEVFSPQRREEGAHCDSNGKVRGIKSLNSCTNAPQASLGPLLLPHGAKGIEVI